MCISMVIKLDIYYRKRVAIRLLYENKSLMYIHQDRKDTAVLRLAGFEHKVHKKS